MLTLSKMIEDIEAKKEEDEPKMEVKTARNEALEQAGETTRSMPTRARDDVDDDERRVQNGARTFSKVNSRY